jgi:hypothetical protein
MSNPEVRDLQRHEDHLGLEFARDTKETLNAFIEAVKETRHNIEDRMLYNPHIIIGLGELGANRTIIASKVPR